MIQIICTLVLFLLILFPVGNYIYHISAGKKTWADPLFDRVDNVIFKSLRIDRSPMSWKQYALHLLLVNACLVAACIYAAIKSPISELSSLRSA